MSKKDKKIVELENKINLLNINIFSLVNDIERLENGMRVAFEALVNGLNLKLIEDVDGAKKFFQ